ncbi:MAG: sulfatase, partial [Planctomycetota bacterium JB042]
MRRFRPATLLPFVLVLAAVAWPTCADRSADGGGASGRPHRILLVTIDTLRADHLPWHGYPRPTAPSLAALTDRSLVFETAVSAASHTAPSHASMLTGLYPAQHGVLENGMSLGDDALPLARLLRDAGYRTGAFSSVSFLFGLDRGFDRFDAPAPIDEAAARSGEAFERYRPAVRTVDAALRWLDEQGETGAFAWVHLFDVHEWMRDEPVAADLAAVGAPSDDEHFRFLLSTDAINPSMSSEERAAFLEAIDRYDAKILAVDREVRRLIEEADRAAPGRTVALITSDHGEGLFAHGYEGHGRELYEEQIAVPLLVHATDGSLVGRTADLVRTVDVFPTLLEAAGVAVPPLLECADPALGARSLLPYARDGGRGEPGRLAFAQR